MSLLGTKLIFFADLVSDMLKGSTGFGIHLLIFRDIEYDLDPLEVVGDGDAVELPPLGVGI
jgi:hypothetical protein